MLILQTIISFTRIYVDLCYSSSAPAFVWTTIAANQLPHNLVMLNNTRMVRIPSAVDSIDSRGSIRWWWGWETPVAQCCWPA